MGANSTLLRFFLKMPKSPLLVTTSPCETFDLHSTEYQNGGREPEVLVPEIAVRIYVTLE